MPAPLLLIAHGTRDPRGAEEMDVLVGHVARRLGTAVGHAWLEDFAEPGGADAARALAPAVAGAGGVLVTLPLLNFAAGHAKTDVPGEVADVRAALTGVDVRHGTVLGVHSALLRLGWARLDAATSPEPGHRTEEVLVVAASGSSDPDANGELAKAARMLADGSGHRWVEHCFAGVTWPRTEEVLRRVAAAGARRVVLFSWSLLAGLLERRVRDAADTVAAETGLEVVHAGRFGPDALVAEAIAERYAEALGGDARANCDLCAYRLPLPGRASWVAAPSPGGTGERVATAG